MRVHVVFGASGAIGGALVTELAERYPLDSVYAVSRRACTFAAPNIKCQIVDATDEPALAALVKTIASRAPIATVIVATGLLHDDRLSPEKSLRDLSQDKFSLLFQVNTIVPALIAKHFVPYLPRDTRSVFAALSARVGSISDNHLGGWYAYRASKAALNMILKCTAIEIARKNKSAIIVGLHPGTVDSDLSKPFQKNVSAQKLFTPAFSAARLVDVVTALSPDDSGKCFAWDGQEIDP